jgi:hypothetical protein
MAAYLPDPLNIDTVLRSACEQGCLAVVLPWVCEYLAAFGPCAAPLRGLGPAISTLRQLRR